MTLEQQVASLELCKKLKELNVKQESNFSWSTYSLVGPRLEMVPPKGIQSVMPGGTKGEAISAFTVAELGEMLPEFIVIGKNSYWVNSYIDEWSKEQEKRVWGISYKNIDETHVHQEADTEADARAKMLIYLLENKLIAI